MILAKLKEATKIQHEQLEATVDLINRVSDIENYATLLQRFYGFYAPLEPQILRAFQKREIDFDYKVRLKIPLLKRDLQSLNDADFKIDALAVCKDFPVIENFAQSLGCAYVFEGATLGGQFIGRHLRERLNLTRENGAAFFNSYGEAVGRMWKAFGAMATAQAETLKSDEEIIAAARETFTKFDKWVG